VQPAWIYLDQSEGINILKLGGNWLSTYLKDVDEKLLNLSLPKGSVCKINWDEIEDIDTNGAWLIQRQIKIFEDHHIKIKTSKDNKKILTLLDKVCCYEIQKKISPPRINPFILLLIVIGKYVVEFLQLSLKIISFLGLVTKRLALTVKNPKSFRFKATCAIIQRTGINALPIVGLLSFLIGLVLVYQGLNQLQRFGAEIFTVDLLGISVLRELGVLITSIIIAGRSGSAFAAQIGTMKLNQEIDAMHTLGLHPIDLLVIPRIVALVIALPLLTFFSDIVAIVGGSIMTYFLIGLSFEQFFEQLNQALGPWTFWIGLMKAPVFAVCIALIGCFEGFEIKNSAEELGRHTTLAVVEAIFLIIVFDAFFSVFFSEIGI